MKFSNYQKLRKTYLWAALATIVTLVATFGMTGSVVNAGTQINPTETAKEWVPLSNFRTNEYTPKVTATGYTSAGMNVEVEVYGFYKESIDRNNDGLWDRLSVPGQGYHEETGTPNLPMVRYFFSIPGTTGLRAVVSSVEYVEFKDLQVEPLQPLLKEDETEGKFSIDQERYTLNSFIPKDLVEVSVAGIKHGIRLGMVEINPFLYNPVTRTLRVAKNIDFKIEFTGTSNEFPVYKETTIIPPQLKRSFQKLLLNYQFTSFSAADLECCIDYLIIADPALVNHVSLQNLKLYHESQGLDVEIVDVSTIGTTSAQIKAYIQAEYDCAVPADLDYVLLVGDVSVIPFKQSAYGTTDSDIWYAWLDGGDMFGDVGLGRFPARNTTELSYMVNKSLNHHNNADPGPWQNKVSLIANKELYPGKYTACKNNIFNATYSLFPPVLDKIFGGDPAFNWTNNDITDMIEEGRAVINYRGHGSTTAWTNWNLSSQYYTVTQVQGLANGLKTPIIFSIACSNLNMESASETLGEAFIRHDQGAVAFLGAIHPSYTLANHIFDEGLFRTVWNDGVNEIGELLNAGNMEMISTYGSNGASLVNITMYLWLGDPALKVTNYWNVYNPVVHQTNYLGIACYSPAAVTSMIINKLAAIDPTDPVVSASQSDVITFIDTFTGTTMMTSGSTAENVQSILEQYTGDGNCGTKTNGVYTSCTCAPSPVGGSFNWTLYKQTDVDQILFDIAYWQERNQYAAAVPTGGDNCKWVVIEGVSSEVPPSASNAATYPLRGFFIDDPAATGGYSKTFKSAHFWKDPSYGYYLPTDGSYYEAVIEPPAISGRALAILPFNPKLVPNHNCPDYELAQLAHVGISQMALVKNNNFGSAYTETVSGTTLPVTRTDKNEKYYLVPFYIEGSKEVRVVVMLTEEGQFIEAAYSTGKGALEYPIDPTSKLGEEDEYIWSIDSGTSPYQPKKK
jgi:Peptidase family C25/Propeptide_C25